MNDRDDASGGQRRGFSVKARLAAALAFGPFEREVRLKENSTAVSSPPDVTVSLGHQTTK